MRLKDADRVVITYTDPKGPESDFSKGVEFAMNVYDNLPTIEAISIEGIKDLSNRLKDEDEFEKAMFLLDVIDVWEAENG